MEGIYYFPVICKRKAEVNIYITCILKAQSLSKRLIYWPLNPQKLGHWHFGLRLLGKASRLKCLVQKFRLLLTLSISIKWYTHEEGTGNIISILLFRTLFCCIYQCHDSFRQRNSSVQIFPGPLLWLSPPRRRLRALSGSGCECVPLTLSQNRGFCWWRGVMLCRTSRQAWLGFSRNLKGTNMKEKISVRKGKASIG